MSDQACQKPHQESVMDAMRLSDGDQSFKDNVAWPPRWVGIVLTKEVRELQAKLSGMKKHLDAKKMSRRYWQQRASFFHAHSMAMAIRADALALNFQAAADCRDMARREVANLRAQNERMREALESIKDNCGCCEDVAPCANCLRAEKALTPPAQEESCSKCGGQGKHPWMGGTIGMCQKCGGTGRAPRGEGK